MASGDDGYGQCDVPVGLSNVVAIAAGGYHSLARGWGYNWYGQANGFGTRCGYAPKAISASAHHSLALLSNGTVYAWGYNDQGQLNVRSG